MNDIKYSYVYVEIPEPFRSGILTYANELIEKDQLTEQGLETDPHVTIKYGIKTNDVGEVAKALGKFNPIRLMFGITSVFIADDIHDYDVVKIDIFGLTLSKLRKSITDNLNTVDQYKLFYPHITLGFVEPKTAIKYIGTNPVMGEKVVVDSVVFSNMDKVKWRIKNDGSIIDYA